jgi:hypothetical protein
LLGRRRLWRQLTAVFDRTSSVEEDIMRNSLLTTALMMAAAIASADEPPAAQAKTEAAAQTAPATQSEKVAADETTTASLAVDKVKPFKPPPGYRPKRINGEQVYCAKLVVLGSRFPKEDCRTEADLRELALRSDEMRRDVERTRSMCASNNGGCGLN